MKSLKLTFSLVLIFIFSSSCKNNKEAEVKIVEAGVVEQTKAKAKAETEIQNYSATSFTVKGMTCEMGCAKTIEKNLAKLDGVGSAKVDFENERAAVKFDAAKISTDDLIKAVSDAGSKYSVEALEILEKQL